MKSKLQTKYTLMLLLVVVATVFILAGGFLVQSRLVMQRVLDRSSEDMERDLLEQLHNRAELFVRFLSEELINPLYEYDMEKMEEMAILAVGQTDVVYVYFYEPDGRIIQDGTRDYILTELILDDPISLNAVSTPRLLFQAGDDILHVSMPIRFYNKVLGGVRVGFSLEGISADINGMKRDLATIGFQAERAYIITGIILTLVLCLLGLILAILVARRLIRPIKLLTRFTHRVGRGEYDLDIPLKRGDEIGELMAAFVGMAEKLQETTVSRDDLVREVGERKEAEFSLRESEEKFRAIAENIPGVVYLCRNDTRYTMIYLNNAVEEITGYSKEEFLSDRISFADLFHPDDAKMIFRIVSQELASRKPFHLVYRIRHRSGQWRWIEEFGVGIFRGKELSHLAGFMNDISERKRMEDELVKSQKLESVGILAGGIAHDFNNFLATILGIISLNKFKAEPGSELFQDLSEAEEACERARSLTKQLLTFSRGGEPVKEVTHIDKLLRDVARLTLSGSKSSCRLEVAEDLWPAEIDRGQFSQVISNLLINSDQAMPEGGIVEIKAENFESGKTSNLPLDPGAYIRIIIGDEGIGISSHHLDRIFDPYFTTKKKGSGLGLATTYSIVKNHGGLITVESELDAGAVFTIILPANPDAIPAAGPVREKPVRGRGNILAMDDNAALRAVLEKMIRNFGYDPIVVSDGSEAVDAYRNALAEGKNFDLIILDLTVPGGMGGVKTLEELRKIDPDVRVIVSSGYSNDPVMANYREYGFAGIISKPYGMDDLAKLLNSWFNGK